MGKLRAAQIPTLGPGRHSDGDTLTLLIKPSGRRSWAQRLMVQGRRRDLGLGGWPVVSLAMARERALENRRQVWQGIDPREAKRRAKVPTFREACEGMIAANRPRWRNGRTEQTVTRQLEMYAYPTLGNRPVDAIKQADAVRVLAPVMAEKPDTGKRLRQSVRGALAWAVANGYITENYADERIAAALPKRNGETEHHKALPYREVGEVLRRIEASRVAASVKACIRFTVLTAARAGEARASVWSEIDMESATWTIPGKRMKNGKLHRVPLSREALRVLREVRALGTSEYVFPSPVNPAASVSRAAMMAVLRRLGIKVTMHGFRSSFRDWTAEQTTTPREVAEAALSHTNGDETERSYFRSTLFAKRAELMTTWAAYVLTS